jgi:hypothetical protein
MKSSLRRWRVVDGVQVVRDQKVLTIDYVAASATSEEAQGHGL